MYKGKIKNIFFVGIGGSGMSGIAEVLLNMGYKVAGSDIASSGVTERLKSLGAKIFIGHARENIGGMDCVVYSSAVKPDNEELKAARKEQIPIIPRAEMLSELMKMKYGIAVAGTHGKTTTTSMISSIMGRAGMDPTIVTGGKLNSFKANARLGTGEFLVAEADESDGSFLMLSPTIAVVTNIDREHMDHYEDFDEVKAAFKDFLNKVPFYGCAVMSLDSPILQGMLPEIKRRHVTFGLSAQAEVRAESIKRRGMKTSFNLVINSSSMKGVTEITLSTPGVHNVMNALAAAAVAFELGVSEDDIKNGLEEFSGVERRFQLKGCYGDIMVVDDYGHHPEEVKAVLSAVKDGWKRRAVVVFQPHRYSRTRDLFEEFISAFNEADELIITDVYAAGEEPIKSASGRALYKAIKKHGHRSVSFIEDINSIPAELEKKVKAGDMVITLGAGDVYKVSDRFTEIIKEKYPNGKLSLVNDSKDD